MACTPPGMAYAITRSVRPLVLVLALSGCLAGTLDSNVRPSAMPMLSELPSDPEKRNAILDQSGERARPENRRSLTPKQRKVETGAALLAVYIGQAFSKTQNVTIGVATDIEENHLFEKPRPKRESNGSEKGDKAAGIIGESDDPKGAALVPWIQIDQTAKPADGTR